MDAPWPIFIVFAIIAVIAIVAGVVYEQRRRKELAEFARRLGLVVLLFRTKNTLDADAWRELRG